VATKAAAWAFQRWLAERGGTEPVEVRQAIEKVRVFIVQHSDSRFDPIESGSLETRRASNGRMEDRE
jgi:hypothetical protein